MGVGRGSFGARLSEESSKGPSLATSGPPSSLFTLGAVSAFRLFLLCFPRKELQSVRLWCAGSTLKFLEPQFIFLDQPVGPGVLSVSIP